MLAQLSARDDGPFVTRLPREPGRREARYAQLFTGEPPASETLQWPEASGTAVDEPPADRVAQLEQRVTQLEMELAELRRKLGG